MKRLPGLVIVAAMSLGMFGCSTVPVVPFDTGGSRTDGIVTMTADTGYPDLVDWEAGEPDALYRCQQWGYSRVEGFSGVTVKCVSRGCGGVKRCPRSPAHNENDVGDTPEPAQGTDRQRHAHDRLPASVG